MLISGYIFYLKVSHIKCLALLRVWLSVHLPSVCSIPLYTNRCSDSKRHFQTANKTMIFGICCFRKTRERWHHKVPLIPQETDPTRDRQHKRPTPQTTDPTRGRPHKRWTPQETNPTRDQPHKRPTTQETDPTRNGHHKRLTPQEADPTRDWPHKRPFPRETDPKRGQPHKRLTPQETDPTRDWPHKRPTPQETSCGVASDYQIHVFYFNLAAYSKYAQFLLTLGYPAFAVSYLDTINMA